MKWPSYTQEEIKKVTEVIKSGKVNYWTGNEVKNFEKEFTEFHLVKISNSHVFDEKWSLVSK